jgi:hypothetical protein
MWYRIFCRGDNILPLAAFLEHLHNSGLPARSHFRGQGQLDWTAGELTLGAGSPVYLERYLTKEDDLRNDLNNWAAFLETCNYSSNHVMLMERIIQTSQLITIRKPIDHADEVTIDKLCLEVCRYLATQADGIYQIDGDGWYAADGTLLLHEY